MFVLANEANQMKGRSMSRLHVDSLSVSYDSFSLQNVAFDIMPGEIIALVGKNGAGKTTTIDAIMGLTQKQSGNISLDDYQITEKNIHHFKQAVGYVSASQEYYPTVTVGDFVRVIARFYSEWDNTLLDNYLQVFSIDKKKKISELSSGTKVKLALAVALSHRAEVLLLDEPTTGLNPIVRTQVLDIIHHLCLSCKLYKIY